MNFGVEMFGASRGHGSGGVVRPVLIPKRFVWPHGGRRVFLTGSFTRWSAFIPMSPMEGCPTVFQVICSLPPGYHQYKFNVDGEWRHDEHQPFVSGDCGIVNTMYLVREPDILPPILSAETPGQSHMEVDNDIFGHVEANPRMSESDLQVSKHRLSIFLSTHTAYELLPQSGKVVALDITLPVKQAFHALYQEGISMAPVWDSNKCQFVGMLSAMDFILILKEQFPSLHSGCCSIIFAVVDDEENPNFSNKTSSVIPKDALLAALTERWLLGLFWSNPSLVLQLNQFHHLKRLFGNMYPLWLILYGYVFTMFCCWPGLDWPCLLLLLHALLSSWVCFLISSLIDHPQAVNKRSSLQPIHTVLSKIPFLGIHGSNLTEEQLETHTIAAWREAKVQECRTDSNGRTYSQHLVHAGPLECLKDVALKILQNKVATVPIIHSSSEDDSFPQLLHLVSLTEILKCICRHFEHSSDSLPILQLPIGSIPVGTWVSKVGESNKKPLAMLRPNASLGDALSLLIQAEVSSIPIVDTNDSLLDIYSRRDIIALVKDKVYARISLAGFSIHQALLLGRDARFPYGLRNGPRCHMCLRSDSLHKVMVRLANPGVRRLVVVEAGSRRVEEIKEEKRKDLIGSICSRLRYTVDWL
ncbi:hypothetical protein JHK82_057268 [Glycine max]|nr:hypothetical protein JHK84_057151 [Glycine max]KAG5078573.1 hypothetical protein JHK82_057268 [Glycine max]